LGDGKKIKNQNAKIKIVELLRRDFYFQLGVEKGCGKLENGVKWGEQQR
jgi:hypothetical protein